VLIAPTVPRLDCWAQRLSDPTVAAGSRITHRPAAIMASMSTTSPSVSATRRRTTPRYSASTDATDNTAAIHGWVKARWAPRSALLTEPSVAPSNRSIA
jgi:hypothetical protein